MKSRSVPKKPKQSWRPNSTPLRVKRLNFRMYKQLTRRSLFAVRFASIYNTGDRENSYGFGGINELRGNAGANVLQGLGGDDPFANSAFLEDLMRRDPARARLMLFQRDPVRYWKLFPLTRPEGTLRKAIPFPPPDLPGN